MVGTCGTSPVCLVSLIQPNTPDRPNRPNEQDRLADFFSILLVSFPGFADHECQVPFQRMHRGATSWDLPTNLNWKPGGVAIAALPVWMKPDGVLWRALSSRRR